MGGDVKATTMMGGNVRAGNAAKVKVVTLVRIVSKPTLQLSRTNRKHLPDKEDQ
jgi:hypothetical protein